MSVGAGTGSGGGGNSGGSTGGNSSGGSGTTSPWECTYTYLALNSEGGFPPGGADARRLVLGHVRRHHHRCAGYSDRVDHRRSAVHGTPGRSACPRPPGGAVDDLAGPEHPHSTPRDRPSSGLATWLWVDPILWRTDTVTATAGGVSATAVARPVGVTWTTGDGGQVVCGWSGRAVRPGVAGGLAGHLLQPCLCPQLARPADAGRRPGRRSLRGVRHSGVGSVVDGRRCLGRWGASDALHDGRLQPACCPGGEPQRRVGAPRRPGGRHGSGVDCDRSDGADQWSHPQSTSCSQSRKHRRHGDASGEATDSPPTGTRDRRALVAVGSLVVVGASIATFAGLYASAGHRTAAVVVVRPLVQGQAITSADLGQADVSVSKAVRYIPVADASVIEGKRAASAIPAGSLLTTGDLASAPAVAAGGAVVGVALKDGQFPAGGLSPGEQVLVVQTGTPGSPLSAPVERSVCRIAVDLDLRIWIRTRRGWCRRSGPDGEGGLGDRTRLGDRAGVMRCWCRSRWRPVVAPVVATASSADQVSLVLLPATGDSRRSGRRAAMTLVGMLSLKGAPGVTTLSCLVATTWPEGGPLVVVEADPVGGDLAGRFGLSSALGWSSLSSAVRRSGRSTPLRPHLQYLPGGLPVLVSAGARRMRGSASRRRGGRGKGVARRTGRRRPGSPDRRCGSPGRLAPSMRHVGPRGQG